MKIKNMTLLYKKSLLLAVFQILVIFYFSSCTTINDAGEGEISENGLGLENSYFEEFNESYPENIKENGIVNEFNLTAKKGKVELTDEIEFEGYTYNGTVPGPVWRVKLGESIKINFKNELPQETTVHFHGIRVPNAMDGVPGVTQEAVEPGGSFVYEFTPKDAGTFWFHPHTRSDEQVEKGLYGVIIVEDPSEPAYSQDLVWVIDDFRILADGSLDERFGNMHDIMHDGRWGNLITVNGSIRALEKVRPGERIRLRLVNTSNARIYSVNFDDLESNVIAVDGMYVKKNFDANGFEIAPGNRLDVDLKIPIDSENKTFSIQDTFAIGRPNILGRFEVEGETVQTSSFPLLKNDKLPDWEGAENIDPVKKYELNLLNNSNREGMMSSGMMGLEWAMNGKVFPDYDPVRLEVGKFQTIEFDNLSSRLHPMHIHGQFFKVLSRNGKKIEEPYFRDTVLIYPKEKVRIGIIPFDEGVWANHCHILEHAEAGMMTLIEVR